MLLNKKNKKKKQKQKQRHTQVYIYDGGFAGRKKTPGEHAPYTPIAQTKLG